MVSSLPSQPADKPLMVVGHAYLVVDDDSGALEHEGKSD